MNKIKFIAYNRKLTKIARKNRRNPTESEKRVWCRILSRKQFKDYKFIKQKPIGNFVVDFYCSELMLAIEIDGGSHDEQKEYDIKRTKIPNGFGIEVMRYTNYDVMNNLEGVYEDLEKKVENRVKILRRQKPSLALPCQGENGRNRVFATKEYKKRTPLIRGARGVNYLASKTLIHVLSLFGLGAFLLLPSLSSADTKTPSNLPLSGEESITRRIYLDAETIAKGYTVGLLDQGFRVGIFPSVFKEESSIKLEKLDESELENAPEGKSLISDLYLYDISMDRPYVLDDPIVLALGYESSSVYKKEVHFYNRETGGWQAIPTQIDYENKEARAYIHFPYSKIAVFEDQTYSDGPEKVTDSNGVWLDGLAGVLVDDRSGKILFEKNANQKLPLASLTKVMTATIFLENGPGMNSEIMISSYDSAEGAHISLVPGDVVRTGDLFFTTLVGSKNNAAKALARSTGMSTNDFVNRMNAKASELGLSNTSFVEMTGLDWRNQASAIDYAKLSIYAYKKMEMLQASTTRAYGFYTINSGKYLSCNNTNKLLNGSLYITGGKTGYLPYSWGGVNYNLMVKARDNEGNEIVGVIMGNNNYYDLQYEMESLINWGFENYRWN